MGMDLKKLDTVCYALAHCQLQIHLFNDYNATHFAFYDEWADYWDRLEEIYEGEIEATDEDVILVNELYDIVVGSGLIEEIADMITK